MLGGMQHSMKIPVVWIVILWRRWTNPQPELAAKSPTILEQATAKRDVEDANFAVLGSTTYHSHHESQDSTFNRLARYYKPWQRSATTFLIFLLSSLFSLLSSLSRLLTSPSPLNFRLYSYLSYRLLISLSPSPLVAFLPSFFCSFMLAFLLVLNKISSLLSRFCLNLKWQRNLKQDRLWLRSGPLSGHLSGKKKQLQSRWI